MDSLSEAKLTRRPRLQISSPDAKNCKRHATRQAFPHAATQIRSIRKDVPSSCKTRRAARTRSNLQEYGCAINGVALTTDGNLAFAASRLNAFPAMAVMKWRDGSSASISARVGFAP